MTETWKPIPDFPGYEASDHGQVRSYWKQGGQYRWAIVDIPQRVLKYATTPHGYRGVNLRRDSFSHFKRVASLVMLAFVGPRPEGLEICHGDNDPGNNHLSNLRYDTRSNNMLEANGWKLSVDKIIEMRERRASGEDIHVLASDYEVTPRHVSSVCAHRQHRNKPGPRTKSTFSELQIINIRTKRANGMALQALADEYGITESAMSYICTGKRYAYFGGPLTFGRPTPPTPQAQAQEAAR